MSDLTSERELISEETARELTASYLHERYYDFDKVLFSSVENARIQETPVYLIYGTVHVKSRSMFDRLLIDKEAFNYKFMVEVNAVTGRIINYELE
ncbi:MAG: hypothetical protein NTZ34_05745 [Chloroflexi bacterium]|nr:hypothetical protein [Chloroflexota bacterium]